ncbi:hypothetical protein LF63_0110130 [Oleiagrimonas soli]|uniref:Uncharacterized protein n=1 Tax=Oleiagrimonas soli TaxID=1543381 RepID=A0A099CVJ9_9GAMM|nr:hypothetical protein LF63_0110130 [Oleiagrimonas soli]
MHGRGKRLACNDCVANLIDIIAFDRRMFECYSPPLAGRDDVAISIDTGQVKFRLAFAGRPTEHHRLAVDDDYVLFGTEFPGI